MIGRRVWLPPSAHLNCHNTSRKYVELWGPHTMLHSHFRRHVCQRPNSSESSSRPSSMQNLCLCLAEIGEHDLDEHISLEDCEQIARLHGLVQDLRAIAARPRLGLQCR